VGKKWITVSIQMTVNTCSSSVDEDAALPLHLTF